MSLRRAPKARVDVTADIIASAIRHSSGHCMISASIQACIPDAEYISTDLQTIRWTNRAKRERYVYFTPPIAQQALIKFDQGDENIESFKFTLYQGQIVEMQTRQRSRRSLIPSDNNSHPSQLQVTGGTAPPMAALASGSGTGKKSLLGPLSAGYRNRSTEDSAKIGRRRRFGLRALRP